MRTSPKANRRHDGGAGRDEEIGRDHDPLPVPTVDEDSVKGPRRRWGRGIFAMKEKARTSPVRFRCSAGQGVADDGAAQRGEQLSGPDDDEGSFPVVHGISYEIATGPVSISGRLPHVEAARRITCFVSFCAWRNSRLGVRLPSAAICPSEPNRFRFGLRSPRPVGTGNRARSALRRPPPGITPAPLIRRHKKKRAYSGIAETRAPEPGEKLKKALEPSPAPDMCTLCPDTKGVSQMNGLNRRGFIRRPHWLAALSPEREMLFSAKFPPQETASRPKIQEYRVLGHTGFKVSDIGSRRRRSHRPVPPRGRVRQRINYIDAAENYVEQGANGHRQGPQAPRPEIRVHHDQVGPGKDVSKASLPEPGEEVPGEAPNRISIASRITAPRPRPRSKRKDFTTPSEAEGRGPVLPPVPRRAVERRARDDGAGRSRRPPRTGGSTSCSSSIISSRRTKAPVS